MLIAMETTQSVGGGEPGTQLPFIDVRSPQPPASDLGQLWVAWRPLEANEGWLDRDPFHLASPWAAEEGKALAQDSVWAPRVLLAREGRGTLSVRTCQKRQAEIRAATHTRPAKNSPTPGRGFPTDGLARHPCVVGGLVWDESTSRAGQLRTGQGQGKDRDPAHSFRKATFKCEHRLCASHCPASDLQVWVHPK